MLRKLLFTLCIVLTSWSLAYAQVGRLQGVVVDKDTGEPIPFANIILENGGTLVGGASSDFDGNYDINPIPPGTYDLKATFVGYNTYVLKGIVIPANKITCFLHLSSLVPILARHTCITDPLLRISNTAFVSL